MAARLALLCCLCVALLVPACASAPERQAGVLNTLSDLRLAVLTADDTVPLSEILGNRADVGFNPVLRRGVTLAADPKRTIWLRVRADAPADGSKRFLSLPRQAIDRVSLYIPSAPGVPQMKTGLGLQDGAEYWPDAFIVPMPHGGVAGTSTAYLAIKGRGLLNLQVDLLNEEMLHEQKANASGKYSLLYGSLLLIGILAMVRRWTKGEPGYRLAQAAFATLAASMVDAYHLQLSIAGAPLTSRPNLPVALWILACAALLRATQQFAGHEKNSETARFVEHGAWAVAALGVLVLFLPVGALPHLQVFELFLLLLTSIVCFISLFHDPRHWRWTMLLAWGGVLVALLALPTAWMQLMPETVLARRGYQLLLALLLGCYLLLPWVRQALRLRAMARRAVVIQPSAEEKIAHAREWLVSSLRAGMEAAAGSDMEWIAYRRLMAGLKPVLPQTASAVIAMNYHNEDLLLVDPADAEPRFRMLLSQRASLLKNLSRSLGPQQIVLDFDGPEGPLDHVMLAVIPLPIERPGWGALVIERDQKDSYSEQELDMCTEFAALATTAADEAGQAMAQKHVREVDADSGGLRAEMLESHLARAMELSNQKRKPLGILRVAIDGYAKLAPDGARSVARSVANTMREEIDFGEAIVRRTADEFIVLLAGRSSGEMRALGERFCTEMRRHPLPGSEEPLTVSVGVAQMLQNERTTQLVLERSARALTKAQTYGGNQVQLVAGNQ